MERQTTPDLWLLYQHMLFSRVYEEAVRDLWQEGLISGEMHLGLGEEAIVAGVVAHLREGDAMALDHRGTPPMLMRGVDPVALLREMLGRRDGLCAGQGGHMHLFSREHLAASSGIVGASGPAAVGFALSGQRLRLGSVSVAFFGEGATNQGMMLEAMNLAATWQLPVLFVCKDDSMGITTLSPQVTGGSLVDRARAFGLQAQAINGSDVEAVWRAAGEALSRARQGAGPTFLHASCVHLEGHMMGIQTLRIARRPLKELPAVAWPMLRAFSRRKGGSLRQRLRAVRDVLAPLRASTKLDTPGLQDPLALAQQRLAENEARLQQLAWEVQNRVDAIVRQASGAAHEAREAA